MLLMTWRLTAAGWDDELVSEVKDDPSWRETHEGDSDGELLDSCIEPTAVERPSGVTVDDQQRGDAVDESVEDGRDVGEALGCRLRDQSTGESEVDGGLGRESQGSSAGDGSDHRRGERVEESD